MSQLPNQPLGTMTKTELEMQDFSWKNIIAFGVIALLLGVAVKLSNKNK